MKGTQISLHPLVLTMRRRARQSVPEGAGAACCCLASPGKCWPFPREVSQPSPEPRPCSSPRGPPRPRAACRPVLWPLDQLAVRPSSLWQQSCSGSGQVNALLFSSYGHCDANCLWQQTVGTYADFIWTVCDI